MRPTLSYMRARARNSLAFVVAALRRLQSRIQAFDLAGAFFAMLYGLPSLLYPFGADQSLFFYVGQMWFSGGLPYRDAVDQKPPGIFALYGTAIALIGPHSWAIHALELAGVPVLGWCISRIVVRQRPVPDGVLGLGCVVVSVVYFTCFDYWCTGQAEFWQALFSLASFTVVICDERPHRSALAGGALAGLATLFKPSLPLLLVVMLCAVRAARTSVAFRARVLAALRAIALYGASAAAVIGLALLPFALSDGGLQAMYECLFEYNRTYASEQVEIFDRSWQFQMNWRWVGLWVVAVCTLTVVAFGKALDKRRMYDVRTGLMCIGLLAFACMGVLAQGKFFLYHWVVAAPFLALVVTWALVELTSSVRGVMIATLFSAMLLVTAGTLLPSGYHIAYSSQVKDTWHYVRGEISFSQFSNLFPGPFGNNQSALRRVAALIRGRARPHDTLCVRGFMPAIYVYSGLRCPSRFPWEQHLGSVWQPPISSYPRGDIRAAWMSQHRSALAIHPPTFLVTYEGWGVDRYMRRFDHYQEIEIVGVHVILERDRSQPDPNDRR